MAPAAVGPAPSGVLDHAFAWLPARVRSPGRSERRCYERQITSALMSVSSSRGHRTVTVQPAAPDRRLSATQHAGLSFCAPPPTATPDVQVAVAVPCSPAPMKTSLPTTTVTAGRGPVAPVAPVGPAGPVGPPGPVGPVSPVGPPAGPVGPGTVDAEPVGPLAPVGPVGPVGPVTAESAPVGPVGRSDPSRRQGRWDP